MKEHVREFQLDPHTTVHIDWAKLQHLTQDLKGDVPLGLLGGLLAGAAATAVWVAVAALTGQPCAWMAVGVGVLVGLGVRALGRGITSVFGLMGAGLAVLACISGDLCATLIVAAEQLDMPFSQWVATLDARVILELLQAGFGPLDLLFYALAVYQGSDQALRRIKDRELAVLICKP
ncbi:MAG TPA: hypothetical protein VIL47_02295 [Candidatus Bipolaricaulota bacterium]